MSDTFVCGSTLSQPSATMSVKLSVFSLPEKSNKSRFLTRKNSKCFLPQFSDETKTQDWLANRVRFASVPIATSNECTKFEFWLMLAFALLNDFLIKTNTKNKLIHNDIHK